MLISLNRLSIPVSRSGILIIVFFSLEIDNVVFLGLLNWDLKVSELASSTNFLSKENFSAILFKKVNLDTVELHPILIIPTNSILINSYIISAN